jgi:UDP-glucuronate 4-epimerase
VLFSPPKSQSADDNLYRVHNIGYGQPVELMDFIGLIEQATGIQAIKEYVGKQPGDVDVTWADTRSLTSAVGYTPKVAIQEGIPRFVEWYRAFYQI